MKPGDFVAVHAPDGTVVGKLISDDGDTVTVSFNGKEFYNIPKEIVTLYVSV